MSQPLSHSSRRRRGALPRMAVAVLALLGLAAGVAAPPWALTRFVGWPLPDHVPSVGEVWATLSSAPGVSLVIDVLACVCWMAWAAFVLDVMVSLIEAAVDGVDRLRDRPATRRGPAWCRPGAALVGLVLLAVITSARPATPRSAVTSSTAVADTSLSQPLLTQATGDDAAPGGASMGDQRGNSDDPDGEREVIVRPPTSTSVHDSLWRIADRELGDPNRWAEVFDLNIGRVQPSGGVLTDPDLIQPGWHLVLPTTGEPSHPPITPSTGGPTHSAPNRADPADSGPTGPAETGPNSATGSNSPAGATPSETGWINVGPSVAVTTGFAALVAAALAVAARRRHRRTDTPSTAHEDTASGDRPQEYPVFPVVHEIARQAPTTPPMPPSDSDDSTYADEHVVVGGTERDIEPDVDDRRPDDGGPARATSAGPSASVAAGGSSLRTAALVGNGIGLAGPGALPALRALLLDLLLTPNHPPVVVVGDLPSRMGLGPASVVDGGATHVEDLDSALADPAAVDARFIGARGTVVLAAAPEPGTASPLPSPTGHVVILYGSWRAGATAHVGMDGTIVAVAPTAFEDLVGQRLPILDVHTATEMLDLAREAGQPEPARSTHHDDRSETVRDPLPPYVVAFRDDLATDVPTQGRNRHEAQNGPQDEVEPEDRSGPGHHMSSDDGHALDHQTPPWLLSILGPPVLHLVADTPSGQGPSRVDITGRLSPRMQDLLVFLALHPEGVRRDAIVAALWPDTGAEKPGNNLSALVSRLRTTIRGAEHPSGQRSRARVVVVDGDRYRLDPSCLEVDYWTFLAATVTARSITGSPPLGSSPPDLSSAPTTSTTVAAVVEDPNRLAALHTVHDLYRGPLAHGIDHEWILSTREAARRAFLDATSRLVRHQVHTHPAAALHTLETTRNLEPTNEKVYQDIIALQLRLGDNSGAAATMRLLRSQLADVEEAPTPATAALAQRIYGHDAEATEDGSGSLDDSPTLGVTGK